MKPLKQIAAAPARLMLPAPPLHFVPLEIDTLGGNGISVFMAVMDEVTREVRFEDLMYRDKIARAVEASVSAHSDYGEASFQRHLISLRMYEAQLAHLRAYLLGGVPEPIERELARAARQMAHEGRL